MTLGHATRCVPDVAATEAFHEAAFGLERRSLHESGACAEMETGATALASAPEALPEGGGVALRRTRQDGEPPGAKPWGQVAAYVRDVNGAPVELCTPLE